MSDALPSSSVKARVVGRRQPLLDGVEKVTGRARFTADLPAAHALTGAILSSPMAHAEIVRIDTSRARRLRRQ